MGIPTTTFYGTATVGSKGQIVIPADAREALRINTGDKLVILGLKDNTILGICPVNEIETMLTEMTKKLASIRDALKTDKE